MLSEAAAVTNGRHVREKRCARQAKQESAMARPAGARRQDVQIGVIKHGVDAVLYVIGKFQV